jgi:site-specific DNA-methyltransferase (adenine-specific)
MSADIQGKVIHGENLKVLKTLTAGSFQLIYIDPPFNTGKKQSRTQIKTQQNNKGDRKGFGGNTYETTVVGNKAFDDQFDDYIAFLEPRLLEAYRLLASNGSFYFHVDYREVHYCKLLLDKIFGRKSFLNEIIWAYDYGARPKKRWPAKHDNILMYVKDPDNYIFNSEDIDRIPYMAPGLVGEEKAKKGKLPTDTWWHTIVSPTGKEKTGYPTQKPIAILKRIISASSNPADTILDFFGGSGTTGAAALELNRNFTLVDNNPESIDVMKDRFESQTVEFLEFNEEN